MSGVAVEADEGSDPCLRLSCSPEGIPRSSTEIRSQDVPDRRAAHTARSSSCPRYCRCAATYCRTFCHGTSLPSTSTVSMLATATRGPTVFSCRSRSRLRDAFPMPQIVANSLLMCQQTWQSVGVTSANLQVRDLEGPCAELWHIGQALPRTRLAPGLSLSRSGWQVGPDEPHSGSRSRGQSAAPPGPTAGLRRGLSNLGGLSGMPSPYGVARASQRGLLAETGPGSARASDGAR